MAQVRKATAGWQGDLQSGSGEVSARSGVFTSLPTSWKWRTEAAENHTSPEELLAAAHASCYSMAFSNELAKTGHPPEGVDVAVEVTADKREQGWTVLSSAITVHAHVHDIDEADFQAAAARARDGCPISRALAGNIEMTVQATLVR